MENNFIQRKNTKENVNLLLDENFKQEQSAIFDNKSDTYILINKHAKTFWITCQEGLKDASQIINEMFNQKIVTKCQN
ncbi:hypothetical protein [Flavobacterium sp.]|uniref:hypothetical protein n=1 Tax=Flavobacterium sp. TaxID=239 RepID=UPI00375072CE